MSGLTADRVRELLHYDQATGAFHWRVTRGSVKAGAPAGVVNGVGYSVIRIDKRLHASHRLAWLHAHGVWPTNDIDHMDGNRANNQLSNLRDVPRAHNLQNQRDGRTGLLGAYWFKNRDRWAACIGVGGKRKHLGYFDTEEQAHEAYVKAKRVLHPGNLL